MSFLRPKVVLGRELECDIVFYEGNHGDMALADNSLSSGRSEHLDMRWHFCRDMLRTGVVKLVHVGFEGQHSGILMTPLTHLVQETSTCPDEDGGKRLVAWVRLFACLSICQL